MIKTSTSLLAAIFCFFVTACAHHYQPNHVTAPRLIGKISLVNEKHEFVLIDSRETPQPGTLLKAITERGEQSATLIVAAEKNPPFIIANFRKGTPHAGDQAFQ